MTLVRRIGVLIAVLAAAATWSGSALAADVAPFVSSGPTLSDFRPAVGETLTVSSTWADELATREINLPITYRYQWVRCPTGGGCGAIAGATGSSYVVTPADAGATLHVGITATNMLGSGYASSADTQTILPLTVGTDHVLVHYAADSSYEAAITETQAGDLAALAEHAYATEIALGYPPPAPDGGQGGDSRVDFYVVNIADPWDWGFATWSTATGIGYIDIDGIDPSQVAWQGGIAHELFHLIQGGIWPGYPADDWLLEGSAEWMAYRVDEAQREPNLGSWDTPLDCADPSATSVKCDLTDRYRNVGYSRWPFFEYLSERYGSDFVKTIFTQGATGAGSGINAVSSAIGAKGGSFSDVFVDWTVANMTGDYSMDILQGLTPPTYGGSPLRIGTLTSLNATTKPGEPKKLSGPIPTLTVPVNHLSARYVALQRGNPDAPDTPCYAARLKLSVAVPGVGGRPFFWWSQKTKTGANLEKAVPLDVNGGTATIDVPWDTCDWGTTRAYLVLPNPSTTLDARSFTISGTLTVDTGTQATPTAPPDPVKQHGTPVDIPSSGSTSADGVPQIDVFGPEVIRLASSATSLRLIVSSDGSGMLKAALGSLTLGTKPLRAGGNDLRFTLPKTVLRTIRKTSAAANLLTLTPLSSAGASGKSVTRRVVVTVPKVTAGAQR